VEEAMTIEEKKKKLRKMIHEADQLRQEIKDDEARAVTAKLTKLVCEGKQESFISAKGRRWWKLPKSAYRESYCTYYFLTDLQGHYIPDKTTYEGHRCKPGWAVGGGYCHTEQQAIDSWEREPWYTRK
jgi:hypothetical protein